MENTAAQVNDFYPNEFAVRPFNAEWNFMRVVSLGTGDGGIDVQVGGGEGEGSEPYAGLDDIAAMIVSDSVTDNQPAFVLTPQAGPGIFHVPEGSVIERYSFQFISGRGAVPVVKDSKIVTADGIADLPAASDAPAAVSA